MINQNSQESTLKNALINDALTQRFLTVRQQTIDICSPLEIEDFAVQPNADTSPPKWHLGHLTWFFEELILVKYSLGYSRFNAGFSQVFNSYYKALGPHTAQSNRGQLSRPTVAQILAYRLHVDKHVVAFLRQQAISAEIEFLIETGIHHEQQHQELLYMDIKVILAANALQTNYSNLTLAPANKPTLGWAAFKEGLYEIGFVDDGSHTAFAYDNEKPNHKSYLYAFEISQTLVTNGDYLAFIEDNAYSKPQYWLSLGWDWVNQQHITQPLYWVKLDGAWHEYTLHGLLPLDLNRPLVHISYFEAEAFARWKNARLPTEQELEVFLNETNSNPNPTKHHHNALHPNDAANLSGEVWCWTQSQYSAYPRFKAFDGLLNEYNGKFMCNQFVLKGGCVVTPSNHYRHSYRNFYPPHQRWMFSGIRLAKDSV